MTHTMYGYVRVSSKEQNETRQLLAMDEFGVDRKNVFLEKQSGKDFNRPVYKALLHCLKTNDVLVVKSIDRLGRNYDEILEQWRFITNIVLQLLSYVAQTERELIRQRQAEGIAAAKARGVHFGPKPMTPPSQFQQYHILWQDGKVSAREAARQLHVSHKTFLKWVKTK
ncbi:MAG: recombinase family protein [Clostridiales bacterium]|nr:recombinase family protein [Clostridiales bacterium]